jgi:hypothetical protein
MVKTLTAIITGAILFSVILLGWRYTIMNEVNVYGDTNFDQAQLDRYGLMQETELNQKMSEDFDSLYNQGPQTGTISVPFVEGIWTGAKQLGAYVVGLVRIPYMLVQDLKVPGFILTFLVALLLLTVIINWKRMFGGSVL